jgi:hypothetical protein
MKVKTLATIFLTLILSLVGCERGQDSNKTEFEWDEMLEKSFEDFKNRKIYKSLTVEILESIPDEKLEQTIIDNIYELIGSDYENELENVKKLSLGQQAFFSIWTLEAEVNNGGFNQFYFNSSGQYAKMAEIGFRRIGAQRFSELTARANKIYDDTKERLEEFNDGTIESFSESYEDNPLNELDTEFYELYEHEKIGELRIKYIRDNLAEFTTK